MMPGNLLRLALGVTGSQTVEWYRVSGRVLNAIGIYVPTYSNPIPVRGSFQVISHTMMAQLGLDFKKEYMTFYTLTDMQDLERDKTGDQFTYCGIRYQVMANEDWIHIAGWNNSIAVKITP